MARYWTGARPLRHHSHVLRYIDPIPQADEKYAISVQQPIVSNRTISVSPVPYDGYRGCFVTYFSTIEAANFIALTVLDTGKCAIALS